MRKHNQCYHCQCKWSAIKRSHHRFFLQQQLPPLPVSSGDALVKTGSLAVHVPSQLMRYCETAGLTGLLRLARPPQSVELFYERGYENTTLDSVAERLGVIDLREQFPLWPFPHQHPLNDWPLASVPARHAPALQDIAHRQPANAPEVRVEIDDDLPALPPNVVHHLRMIAQESVTNALKHARARTIILRLRALDKGVEMSVTDDGAGFDPDSQTQGKPGHFGCMGIRERCRKAGAEVQWTSAPGQGTRLEVRYRP